MAARKVTYSEIAARSGVSKSTVSLVLRDLAEDRIPAATRERVTSAARELGYYPNNLIRSLQRGRTNSLALVAPPVTIEYVARIVEGAREEAARAGFALLISSSATDAEHERQGAERLLQHRADGVIRFVPHTAPGGMPEWLDEAIGRGVPAVVIDDTALSDRVDCVASADEDGGYQATKHLIERGHREIVHLAGSPGKSSALARRRGFERAMDEAGNPRTRENVVGSDYDERRLGPVVKTLLQRETPPTAIFAATDFLAYEFLRCADRPIDIVGYSDWSQSEPLGITTVAQPFEAMGAEAVRRLIARIENPVLPHTTTLLPTRLIVRSSTDHTIDNRFGISS